MRGQLLCTVAKNVTEVSNQMFESSFPVKSQWDLSILLSSLVAWMAVSRGTRVFSLASMFTLALICLKSYNIRRFAHPVILEDCKSYYLVGQLFVKFFSLSRQSRRLDEIIFTLMIDYLNLFKCIVKFIYFIVFSTINISEY